MRGEWKISAKRLGITVQEYATHRGNGELWCSGCQRWHPRASFVVDATVPTGRRGSCPEGAKRWRRQRAAAGKRVELRIAQSESRYLGVPERMRHLVNHFLGGGTKPRPGMGMVVL